MRPSRADRELEPRLRTDDRLAARPPVRPLDDAWIERLIQIESVSANPIRPPVLRGRDRLH